jgi:arginase family enzyme
LDNSSGNLIFQQIYKKNNIKVLVGGEHLLTYFSFLAIKDLLNFSKLKLVIFDAHHDSYNDQPLTHYSFVDWLIEKHNTEVLIVGLRYELESKNSKIQYLSGKESPI